MKGIILDVQTGLEQEVDLIAWAHPNGSIEMLNPGDQPVPGCVLATEQQVTDWRALQALQAAASAKQAQITALLAPVGLTQAWQLDGFMGGALSLAMQQGLTEPQLYASNVAYKMAKDLKTAIEAIRSAP